MFWLPLWQWTDNLSPNRKNQQELAQEAIKVGRPQALVSIVTVETASWLVVCCLRLSLAFESVASKYSKYESYLLYFSICLHKKFAALGYVFFLNHVVSLLHVVKYQSVFCLLFFQQHLICIIGISDVCFDFPWLLSLLSWLLLMELKLNSLANDNILMLLKLHKMFILMVLQYWICILLFQLHSMHCVESVFNKRSLNTTSWLMFCVNGVWLAVRLWSLHLERGHFAWIGITKELKCCVSGLLLFPDINRKCLKNKIKFQALEFFLWLRKPLSRQKGQLIISCISSVVLLLKWIAPSGIQSIISNLSLWLGDLLFPSFKQNNVNKWQWVVSEWCMIGMPTERAIKPFTLIRNII